MHHYITELKTKIDFIILSRFNYLSWCSIYNECT